MNPGTLSSYLVFHFSLFIIGCVTQVERTFLIVDICKKASVLSKSSTVMFNPVGVILVHTYAL